MCVHHKADFIGKGKEVTFEMADWAEAARAKVLSKVLSSVAGP